MIAGATLLAALALSPLHAQTTSSGATTGTGTETASPQSSSGGPIRLRQPAADQPASAAGAGQVPMLAAPPAKPGEFEAFVGLPRFGTELVSELVTSAPDFNPEVPEDYLIHSGDEVAVSLWGTVDADLRLVVDRSGRVTLPRVGPVLLAGVRYGDLQATLYRRVAQVFKGFDLSASLGRLRGVRVFVTGYVQRPGAYVVGGLSTVVNAVMRAGGPAAAGSFRNIELRRGGKPITNLDLYDLILRGERAADRVVLPEDVIHVQSVGPLVAVRGSVNKPAVYELRKGETLQDVLRMAGGLNAVADTKRVALERISDRNAQRVVEIPLSEGSKLELQNGDLIRVFSSVESALSTERQNKRVRVEGEVARPGEFVLPPNSTLSAAVRAAGGYTAAAYPFGSIFTRESVRIGQQENLDRALKDMETEVIRTSSTQRISTQEEAASSNARAAANTRLIDKLRLLQPTGRIVFQLTPDARDLPDIVLEDGDKLVIPAKPTTVGVYGSVFNSGSYLYLQNHTLDDYLRLAGGPTKGADESSVFVVRATGQVLSSRQLRTTWFSRGNLIGPERAEPGDTLFVPEELDRSTFVQSAKDWTLILYQLGIGLAGIKTIIP